MASITELRRRAAELSFVGKHRKAAELYEELLDRTPADAQLALKLGESRRRLGDLPGAVAAYDRAAELYPAPGLEGKTAPARPGGAQPAGERAKHTRPPPP